MAEYRAYTIGHDGHFISFEGFVARDDDDATSKAMRLVNGRDLELWSGERFVTRLNAEPPK